MVRNGNKQSPHLFCIILQRNSVRQVLYNPCGIGLHPFLESESVCWKNAWMVKVWKVINLWYLTFSVRKNFAHLKKKEKRNEHLFSAPEIFSEGYICVFHVYI